MDSYHIALFIHIVTLIVAASATAVTKIAVARRDRARTIGEVLDWHSVLMSAAKWFPICLAAFAISGAYMLSVAHIDAWSSGFVVAGFAGVVLLLISGVYLAAKAKALKHVLEGIATRGADQPAPELVPPPLVAALPVINTGIALGVVFDMVTKPDGILVSLAVVGLGIVLGAAKGMQRSAPALERAPEAPQS